MADVVTAIERVAATPRTTVLVTGESGTGKEIVAREIHRRSARAAKPFIVVNCAGLADGLLEADLFGYAPELRATTHDRGSYTLSLHGYEPAPPRPDDEERGGLGVREPMHPRPSPRSGNIALPLDEA